MNNRVAKKIRKIINPQDKITRKVYRRAKKQYTKTPSNLKADFILFLSKTLSPD